MRGMIRNNVYFLRLLWSMSPARVAHSFVSAVVDFGVWAFSSVVFTRYLFGEGSARSMGEVLSVLQI